MKEEKDGEVAVRRRVTLVWLNYLGKGMRILRQTNSRPQMEHLGKPFRQAIKLFLRIGALIHGSFNLLHRLNHRILFRGLSKETTGGEITLLQKGSGSSEG